jgi:hypothetical protein
MGHSNRVIDFLPELTATQTLSAPSGRKPRGSCTSISGKEPDSPKDLLAKFIAPPPDGRRSDRRFRQLRQQLIDKYCPSDPIQLVNIDLVAADLLHLEKLRQAMALLTAPAVPDQTITEVHRARAARKQKAVLTRLIRTGEQDTPFDCTEKEARYMARRLTATFEHVRSWVAEVDAEVAKPEGSDSADQEYRKLWEVVQPIAPTFVDADQIKETLMGRRSITPQERGCWIALMERAKLNAAERDHRLNQSLVKFEAAERALLVSLAQNPIQLAVLHRVATQFEEAIARRIKRLEPGR